MLHCERSSYHDLGFFDLRRGTVDPTPHHLLKNPIIAMTHTPHDPFRQVAATTRNDKDKHVLGGLCSADRQPE